MHVFLCVWPPHTIQQFVSFTPSMSVIVCSDESLRHGLIDNVGTKCDMGTEDTWALYIIATYVYRPLAWMHIGAWNA